MASFAARALRAASKAERARTAVLRAPMTQPTTLKLDTSSTIARHRKPSCVVTQVMSATHRRLGSQASKRRSKLSGTGCALRAARVVPLGRGQGGLALAAVELCLPEPAPQRVHRDLEFLGDLTRPASARQGQIHDSLAELLGMCLDMSFARRWSPPETPPLDCRTHRHGARSKWLRRHFSPCCGRACSRSRQ